MKHLITIILIALFAVPADIMAQSWNFGIEAGYVNNTLDVSEYKATARSGFKFGLGAEYQLANKICLESGIAYIRKGATTSGIRLSGTEIYREDIYIFRPTKATNIANRTSIHLRPAEADGRRSGDWEMDTIVDSFGHAILTLTERSTNFILTERLPLGRKALPVAQTVARQLFPYRKTLKTITADNGCEFAAHLEITRLLSMKNKEKVTVCFAGSYPSRQKGAVENANKLIRKYIPKKSNFDDFSDKRIREIQKKINRRPREKLNFDTPLRRFFNNIA